MSPNEPLPSATVVLLRDRAPGPEVLLLQRKRSNGRTDGPWVFPGGRVDPEDEVAGDVQASARRAAVRETHEEASLRIDESRLQLISRWITPDIAPKRFDTWFYALALAAEDESQVRVDDSEMRAHRWLRAEDALRLQESGELKLAPPTFVTITWLLGHPNASAALQTLAEAPLIEFRPLLCPVDDGTCMLYPGDAGYLDRDPAAPGARHRLVSGPSGMRYERDDSAS